MIRHNDANFVKAASEEATRATAWRQQARHLVGVDASAQLDPPAEERLQSVLQGRDSGAPADQDDVRHIVDGQGRVLEHGGNRVDAPGEKFVVERLELFPGQLDGQVGVVEKTLHLLHGGARNAREGAR